MSICNNQEDCIKHHDEIDSLRQWVAVQEELLREMAEALEMSWADIYVDGTKSKQMSEEALAHYKEIAG